MIKTPKPIVNEVTDSIVIPHTIQQFSRFLKNTPIEKIYSHVFTKFVFKSGGWDEIGSLCEATTKDGEILTLKTVLLSDDRRHFSMHVLSSDGKCPGYKHSCVIDEATYDRSVLVTMKTKFGEGASEEYMMKIRKMFQECLRDLKLFFGSGMCKIYESCVLTGVEIGAIWTKFKSLDIVAKSTLFKSLKMTKGTIDTIGALMEYEVLPSGDKYTIKTMEFSESERKIKFELVKAVCKVGSAPVSVICGIKFSELIGSKVAIELRDWFSTDIKEEFWMNRKEFLRLFVNEIMKLYSCGKSETEGCIGGGIEIPHTK